MHKMRAQMEETWGGVTKAFKAIDKDRNGIIDYNEFKDVLQDWFAVDDDMMLEIWEKFDSDRSGGVTVAEFGEGLRDILEGELKVVPRVMGTTNNEAFLFSGHPLAAGKVQGIQGTLTQEIMNAKRQEMGGVDPRRSRRCSPRSTSLLQGGIGQYGTTAKTPLRSRPPTQSLLPPLRSPLCNSQNSSQGNVRGYLQPDAVPDQQWRGLALV